MVTELINNLLPSLEHLRVGGYWIAFFAALLETTIGIGLILPGSTIILLLGALSARGYLDVGDLIWFAILGAVIGDNVNYYLGKKYGARWLKEGFWIVKRDYIEKARQIMDSHGAKSVFLGRFIPGVKEIVPLIAGSVNMNPRIFMLWNVLGAIGWGCEWVLAGYIFGQSLNLAELWLSRAGLFFAFLFIFACLFYLCKWLIVKKGKEFWSIGLAFWLFIRKALLNNRLVVLWMHKHPRSLVFLQARFDTAQFSGLPLSMLTLAFVYALTLFAGLVEDLITSDPITAVDIRIANLLLLFRSDGLTNIFTWITLLGNNRVIVLFIFISALLLGLWRKKYYILPLLITVCGSSLFTYLGKLAFHRPRPQISIYLESSFSFPSGHATIAVAFYGFAAYLLMRFAQNWNRAVNIFFVAVFVIMAIGFSRIYLGVHFLSDVLSGYLVGAMWLIIAVSVCEWLRHKERSMPAIPPVAGSAAVSFALVFLGVLGYAFFSMNYHPPLTSIAAENTETVAKSNDIFSSEQLKYTETLTGEKQEPVNFVFLARNDNQLLAVLQQSGWIVSDRASIPAFIKAVKALLLKTPHPAAPISPSFWNEKIQDLSFAKVPGTNWLSNAQHIKIWRTNFLLENGNRIYIAMVNANDGFKWGIIPKIAPDLDAQRERLYLDLMRTGKVQTQRKMQLVKPLTGKNFIGDPFFSDGKVYIISLQ